jgi:hypothetical protein
MDPADTRLAGFKHHLRATTVPAEAVYLIAERGVTALSGSRIERSLYLVCTAMHLAPCALGSADIEAAARAFGTDWRVEPCLGQFIVGSEPDSYARDVKRRHDVNDAEWADFANAYRRDRPWPGAGQ